jgi:DNA-binding NtrC family response regulator
MRVPKNHPPILIADDTEPVREAVMNTLRCAGHAVAGFGTGAELLAALSEETLVCLLDLRMPGRGGFECLEEVKRRSPHTEVVMITGVNEAREAVRAVKAGAFDYLTKPFRPDDLLRSVNRALQLARAARENAVLRQAVGDAVASADLVGSSEAMHAVRAQVARIGVSEEAVLITGESGTGKTRAARALHLASRRAAGPFISVSCPSLPRELLESEMFGHEKGAFSGAHQKRLGRVELAEGGTLFLDEIGEMPLELQPKLLTFLQDRSFFRIGGEKPRQAEVRIIAATNQDLPRLCREGRFREDLFYRLFVVPLELPPLRAHPEDIPELAEQFLRNSAQRNGTPLRQLTPEAVTRLLRHDWPGNIRELENVLSRAALLAGPDNRITVHDFPRGFGTPGDGATAAVEAAPAAPAAAALAGRTLGQIEREALLQPLTACRQSRTQAARMLGVSEKTIYNMMRRHGLAAPAKELLLAAS